MKMVVGLQFVKSFILFKITEINNEIVTTKMLDGKEKGKTHKWDQSKLQRRIDQAENYPDEIFSIVKRYERTWECPDCGYKEGWSYEDLAEKGGPVCPKCDIDMELTDVIPQ